MPIIINIIPPIASILFSNICPILHPNMYPILLNINATTPIKIAGTIIALFKRPKHQHL